MIVIDTIGKLRDFVHPLAGWCRPCGARYRMAAGPGENPPSSFDIDLDALIADRGAAHPVVGMAPVPCPYCGSRQTEVRILGAPKGRCDVGSGTRWDARHNALPPASDESGPP